MEELNLSPAVRERCAEAHCDRPPATRVEITTAPATARDGDRLLGTHLELQLCEEHASELGHAIAKERWGESPLTQPGRVGHDFSVTTERVLILAPQHDVETLALLLPEYDCVNVRHWSRLSDHQRNANTVVLKTSFLPSVIGSTEADALRQKSVIVYGWRADHLTALLPRAETFTQPVRAGTISHLIRMRFAAATAEA